MKILLFFFLLFASNSFPGLPEHRQIALLAIQNLNPSTAFAGSVMDAGNEKFLGRLRWE